MLDLITLGASMGVQGELEKIREQNGEAMMPEQPVESQGVLAGAAQAVSSGLEAVESAVTTVADAMIPTADMFEGMMPESIEAPVIDLSLPTAAEASTKKGE
jgi:hypothetical protein